MEEQTDQEDFNSGYDAEAEKIKRINELFNLCNECSTNSKVEVDPIMKNKLLNTWQTSINNIYKDLELEEKEIKQYERLMFFNRRYNLFTKKSSPDGEDHSVFNERRFDRKWLELDKIEKLVRKFVRAEWNKKDI